MKRDSSGRRDRMMSCKLLFWLGMSSREAAFLKKVILRRSSVDGPVPLVVAVLKHGSGVDAKYPGIGSLSIHAAFRYMTSTFISVSGKELW